MRIISHRGNLTGPQGRADGLAMARALGLGFDVEVDVRALGGKIWLGHDDPTDPLPEFMLSNENISRVWYHAKDFRVMSLLPRAAIAFSHDADDFATVNCDRRLIWVHPKLNSRLVSMIAAGQLSPCDCVILDVVGYARPDPDHVISNGYYGVCTDWVLDWYAIYSKRIIESSGSL